MRRGHEVRASETGEEVPPPEPPLALAPGRRRPGAGGSQGALSVAAYTFPAMTRSTQTFAYLRNSAVVHGTSGSSLHLETSGGRSLGGAMAHPSFFSGFLTSPQAASAALLSVAEVAATHYHEYTAPPGVDPVVTGNGDRLRFESFSHCGGVYARLDVLRDGLDGADVGHGTTNVDVNDPLRDALSRISARDPLHLQVGPDELAVTTVTGRVVEKKVPLPDRWLRGFAETQAIAADFDLRAELRAADAVAFLRSLPRGTSRPARAVEWVVPTGGRTLRRATRQTPGAVCLPGPGRLVALRRVLRHATALRVYGPRPGSDGAASPSAWEAVLPGMRLTLTLSPGAGRGLSGEGRALEALSGDDAAADAELLSVLLAWEPRIDPVALAEESGLSTERVKSALARLGTAGQVGYDIAEAAYFHRELPYDAGRVEKHNPRLRAARALVDAGAVRLEGDLATVISGDHTHRVRLADGALNCTCPWWAAYRGGRGPCKHALAVGIVRRGATETDTGTKTDTDTNTDTAAGTEAGTGARAGARTEAAAAAGTATGPAAGTAAEDAAATRNTGSVR
jgi:hypothetical protein